MHIVRIITRLNIGGPALQVALLSTRLDAQRFSTCVVIGQSEAGEGDLSGLLEHPGLRTIRLRTLRRPIRPWSDLWTFLRLVRILWKEQPEVVHTHTAKAGALGRGAAILSNRLAGWRRRPRSVVLHTFHGHVLDGYFHPVASRVFTQIERWLARRTDVLIAVSPSVRDDLIQRGIGDPARIQVIPLGLDLSAFVQVGSASGVLRRELGLEPTTPLIGIVGRLAPIKQHDLFLRVAQAVLHRDPSSRFVIVGDGERRADLEAMARQLGIDAAVTFVGWRRDLPAVYADLDCVCLTSRNEGTPVSVIEALACARPVVATAVGGVPDLLGTSVERGDGYAVAQRGLLVPWSAQPQGFVAAVERLLADRVLADRVGQAGRAFVREHLTAERLIQDMEALLEEVQVP